MSDVEGLAVVRQFCFWGASTAIALAAAILLLFLHEVFLWWAVALIIFVLGLTALGFGKMWALLHSPQQGE